MKKGFVFGLFLVALLAYVNRRVTVIRAAAPKPPDPFNVDQ